MTTRLRGELFGQDGFPYYPHQGLLAAANTALLLGAPLLLTGEPGCGKTDFAWAAARGLGRQLQSCYVRSDTRARDLLYHYDAVRRFADAQGGRPGEAAVPARYIELMPLGQALLSPQQAVVLIDEIDKAPRDLPNDLLWELDRGHFEISEIGPEEPPLPPRNLQRVMKPAPLRDGTPAPRPLIIITSNVERQLPDAFLRRCVFFHIPFPAWPDEVAAAAAGPRRQDSLEDILRGRLRKALPVLGAEAPRFLQATLQVLRALRTGYKLTKKPATAELLSWAQGLLALHADPDLQAERRREGAVDPVQQLLRATQDRLELAQVPGLFCLLKLREDLAKVGLAEEGGRA